MSDTTAHTGDPAPTALTDIKSGTRVTVVSLNGGDGFRDKVISMGLIPGTTLRVRSYSRSGPLVVQMEGSRVALGRDLATRIMVVPESE
jgi:ferrous iron transport protein A